MQPIQELWVVWTTLPDEATALRFAQELVEARLVACAQVDGPLVSWYRWEGQSTSSREWRLTLKCPAANLDAAEAWVLKNHPYTVAQWLAMPASRVAPAYLAWAGQSAT